MPVRLRLGSLLLCLGLLAWPLAALPVRADCGLNNNGFEDGFTDRTGDGRVVVADGWDAWYQEGPGQEDGMNWRPNFGQSDASLLDGRWVHSGSTAQTMANLYATHNAGLFQRVSVAPGNQVTFTAWALAWSSSKEDRNSVTDPGGYHLSVGIDPTGGTDWAADSVVWSEPRQEYNTWLELSISAQAQANVVTVFLRGQSDTPVTHNESVWDDACVTVSQGTPEPTEPPTPTPTPTLTPTPAPIDAPSPAAVAADVCFQGFEDANGNGRRDAGEAPLAGVSVSLQDAAGKTAAEGLTSGGEDALCFSNVPAGDYQVVVLNPAGYEATGEVPKTLNVSDLPVWVDLGYRAPAAGGSTPATATPVATAAPPTSPSSSSGFLSRVGQGLYGISGILVALLAVGILVLGPRIMRSDQ